MSVLSDALDALSAPGRLVRGALAGRPGDMIDGEELLAGYGLGTGSGLADAALGFGVDTLTDPLTLLGGAGGARAGLRLGGRLDDVARQMGPGYATTYDDIIGMVRAAPAERLDDVQALDHIRALNEANPRVWSEVAPGSRFLGAGQEGTAFATPGGRAVRLELPTMVEPYTDAVRPGRPLAGPVLQASRAVDYPALAGEYGGLTPRGVPSHLARVEHTPLAKLDPTGDYWFKRGGAMGRTRMGDLKADAGAVGLNFWDKHAGNVGLVDGVPKIIDPGAVTAVPGYEGGFQAVAQAGETSPLLRALLGGDMRRAVEAGLPDPGYAGRLGVYGGAAGSSASPLLAALNDW